MRACQLHREPTVLLLVASLGGQACLAGAECLSAGAPRTDKLNVHIISHAHDDVGCATHGSHAIPILRHARRRRRLSVVREWRELEPRRRLCAREGG